MCWHSTVDSESIDDKNGILSTYWMYVKIERGLEFIFRVHSKRSGVGESPIVG